ncbi:MAG: SRPBCC family protein [Rhodospirillales bacterium]|nr:SRPBCC family protein [Rhodospirillales bacterium]
MLIKTLIALAAIAVVFAAIVATQPSEFRVARSATIAAPAPAVFAAVNDFRNWRAWSPYDGLDPAMKRTYAGAPAGQGASYSWVGNGHAGEGRATIIDSRPNDLIRIQLDFVKPFAGTAFAEFAFKPEGDRTTVEWRLNGTNGFVAKAVHLFMNMDRMVGGQFEQGLAQLKSVVEGAPRR